MKWLRAAGLILAVVAGVLLFVAAVVAIDLFAAG